MDRSVYLSICQYILYFPTEEANLDPNDPRNWELLELVEVRERRGGGETERETERERDIQYIFCVILFQSIPSVQEENKYFRLDKLDDDARFIDEEEYQNNRRFTLLKLRDQGVR